MKRYYIGDGAEAAYRSTLVNCRAGVRPDDDTAAKMGEAIRDGLTKGQSVKHILRANAELFGHCAESTVYGWINDGLFGYVGRSMLPFACCRRKPRRRPVTKTNARCRVGRTMKELYAFLSANPGIVPTELDTVDAFVEEFDEEGRLFLEKLGIVRIPANQVTLHPFLLGAKFQKIADRTTLRKNGVTAKKPADQTK